MLKKAIRHASTAKVKISKRDLFFKGPTNGFFVQKRI